MFRLSLWGYRRRVIACAHCKIPSCCSRTVSNPRTLTVLQWLTDNATKTILPQFGVLCGDQGVCPSGISRYFLKFINRSPLREVYWRCASGRTFVQLFCVLKHTSPGKNWTTGIRLYVYVFYVQFLAYGMLDSSN